MLVFFSILYNPETNALDNIRNAKKLGIFPIVYLNKVDNDNFINELNNIDILILGDNNNVGLGQAFYELEKHLSSVDLKYFIYFDQDTKVEISAWLNILNTFENLFKNTAVGLLYYGHNIQTHSRLVTSSGCLFSLKILNEIGFHDKSYFVEGVDYEFCLRLNTFGYKISSIKCKGIDHQSLQDGFKVNFLFKIINLRIYGKSRTIDFNLSHKRLLKQAVSNYNFKIFVFLLKSFVRHNIMELISSKLYKYKKCY
jgi:rhamnosyltransferase